MKLRWMGLGLAIGLVLALMLGFAFGSNRSGSSTDPGSGTALTQTEPWGAMRDMHVSPAMQRLHTQMPEEVRARCEAMHAQMEQMMDAGGMTAGDMSSHHPGMTGGGVMDPGSTHPGGMMGS